MGLETDYQDGQTALSEDEKKGLLIKTITTRDELDEHEQLNIEMAIQYSSFFCHKMQCTFFPDITESCTACIVFGRQSVSHLLIRQATYPNFPKQNHRH